MLQDLIAAIGPHLNAVGDWREEIAWFGAAGRRILVCRGSLLPNAVGLRGGHVIVFDDMTHLVRAERDAARQAATAPAAAPSGETVVGRSKRLAS